MSNQAYRPRFGFDIRINREKEKKRVKFPATHPCAVPGCNAQADARVPKSRERMDERIWLCRGHLREHNEGWNYFAGMNEDQIRQHCVEAIVGHRPTWPLGWRNAGEKRPRAAKSAKSEQFEDVFSVLAEETKAPPPPRRRHLTKGQLDALMILNLGENASLQEAKARYKELVKRFHPDTNGGDRGTEERLKLVIRAYGHLRASGFA